MSNRQEQATLEEAALAHSGVRGGGFRSGRIYLKNVSWDRAWERYGIATLLLLIWLFAALLVPDFGTLDNLNEILIQSSFVGICAVGMTVVILLGSFDLSVGSTLSLCAWLVVDLASSRVPLLWAIAAALLLGSAIGALNGMLIAFVRIPAFIVTLGMLYIISGYTYVITEGKGALYTGADFIVLGSSSVLGIPLPFLIFVLCALFGAVLLRSTAFGRHVYATGANQRAALIAGVPIRRIQFLAFVLVGFFTALAAILLAARLYAAGPDLEPNFEMNAIATVVLGGTRLSGGRGSMLGTFAAALLFTTVSTVLDLAAVNSFVQQVVVGLVLLVALSIEGIRGRLATRVSR